MKIYILRITLILLNVLLVSACSSDDNLEDKMDDLPGKATLYFDNGFKGDALILGSTYLNSNNEKLTIKRLNYIISNIVLIKTDGTPYVYPKKHSYFIISEEKQIKTIYLENIPSGDYKQIKFGIGVDNQRYLEGESSQQAFWDYASSLDMVWTWSTGYRFINFEGSFTSNQNMDPVDFQVHQGSNTATDNYREITLQLPTTLRVRAKDIPNVHLMTDANVILDGLNKIKLGDNLNSAGTTAAIMGGQNLISIAENTQGMFVVDHVHNGSGSVH